RGPPARRASTPPRPPPAPPPRPSRHRARGAPTHSGASATKGQTRPPAQSPIGLRSWPSDARRAEVLAHPGPTVTPGWSSPLNVEVKVELVRSRAHADGIELLVPLELEPLVHGVLREDVALHQELVVFLDGVEGFFETARHVRDVLQLFRREAVDEGHPAHAGQIGRAHV